MNTPTVVKTEAVMTRARTVRDATTFVSAYDDTEAVYRSLSITTKDWEDMGSPEQITVRILPGDTLNG